MKESYKGFYVTFDEKNPRLVRVATEGKGGKIPNVLTGLFTSKQVVYNIIDSYVAQKQNAKTETEAG